MIKKQHSTTINCMTCKINNALIRVTLDFSETASEPNEHLIYSMWAVFNCFENIFFPENYNQIGVKPISRQNMWEKGYVVI